MKKHYLIQFVIILSLTSTGCAFAVSQTAQPALPPGLHSVTELIAAYQRLQAAQTRLVKPAVYLPASPTQALCGKPYLPALIVNP